MALVGPAATEGLPAATQEPIGEVAPGVFPMLVGCQQVLTQPLHIDTVDVAERAHDAAVSGCHGAVE